MCDHEAIHEYLYGNTFVIYTDNNLLTYVLTCEKFDVTGHCWVAILENYNFILCYQSGMIIIGADTLSHILREKHDYHIQANSVHVLISQAAQGTTLIKAYLCNIQINETLDMQMDPNSMSLEDHGPKSRPCDKGN